jgi:riboflavin synthase
MFTGLIQQIGKLAARETHGNSLRLVINSKKWDPPLAEGESISVNGVCLTAARIADNGFSCDVLHETVACSNLGSKQTGAALNLERAIRAGEPLGGHLVAGHIEGLGTLTRRVTLGGDWMLDFSCDTSLLHQMVPKGSVACDGISLTISSLTNASFKVNVIPYTWQNTNLSQLREGETVNLETDLIGKYVFRWLELQQRSGIRDQKSENKSGKPITEDALRNAGFME